MGVTPASQTQLLKPLQHCPTALLRRQGRQDATTYWWKIWVASGVNGMSRSLQTNYGVRFHNDPEGIVYPYMLVNSVLMKDRYPGLKEFCKKWFKGPEGKAHNKRPTRAHRGFSTCMTPIWNRWVTKRQICRIPYPEIKPAEVKPTNRLVKENKIEAGKIEQQHRQALDIIAREASWLSTD